MKNKIPDFITHYNRGKPFRSISNVYDKGLPTVLAQLNETNSWGLNRFSDPEYLIKRIEVEKRLRSEFISKGGNPTLKYPIYFFLGRNSDFEKHEGNKPYMIKLTDLPIDSVSFTYGDSLLAFDNYYRSQSGLKYQNPLCGQLFKIDEFSKIYDVEEKELHIEVLKLNQIKMSL